MNSVETTERIQFYVDEAKIFLFRILKFLFCNTTPA